MDYYWTEDRIRQSYRNAEFPKMQIGILADLCDCDPEYIRAVLGIIPHTKDIKWGKDGRKRYERNKSINTALLDTLLPDLSKTFASIAHTARCSQSAVQKYYAANAHRFPKRTERKPRDDERILMYLMNPYLTMVQISALTGCSTTSVYRCRERFSNIVPKRISDGRKARA